MTEAVVPLKLWPADVYILIAYRLDVAPTDKMSSINHGVCRDCKCRLLYDGYAFRQAWNLADRRGRPIKFLCQPCATRYEVPGQELVPEADCFETRTIVSEVPHG